MTLIICDRYRVAQAVARALKATRKIGYGIYVNNEVTVAYIYRGFVKIAPPEETADGRLPFIPSRYKMRVTDKRTDRRLKHLFRAAKEVVFASAEGAEAQARFFNICRHFRVGQPTSRMWLTSLDHGIRQIFDRRQKGRTLHDLAQSGLVAAGKDMLFAYNFGGILKRWYYNTDPLTTHEAIAMAYLGRLKRICKEQEVAKPKYKIRIENKSGLPLVSVQAWESEADCAYAASAIDIGDTVRATMTVEDTTRPVLTLQSMLTLQMDAYDNLGFMPSQTISTATRLFELGYLTTPFTDEEDDWGIETIKPMPDDYPNTADRSLYNLIAGRMKANEIVPPEQQTANYAVEIDGIPFHIQWNIDEPKAEYLGTSSQLYTVGDISVIPVNEQCGVNFDFTTVLYNLHRTCTSKLATIPGTPYCRYTHEWGSALEGLQRKGFISVENGEIRLTSEGERLIIDLQPYNLGCGLLSASFDSGGVLLGDLKGRQAITNFEKWLGATIGEMMRYVPKEDGNAPISVNSEDFTVVTEK